jgi:GntR family transcriptional regulator
MPSRIGREKQILEIRGRRDGESSYRVLTQLLRESIYREHYADDDPLPTDLALAQEHGLSRQTVRRAYRELVAEGLVYRVPGRGTFVTPEKTRYRRTFGTVADLMKLQLDTQFELVLPLTDDVHDAAASALELPDRHVFAVTFRRLHLGEAFCLTRVFLPPRMARKLTDVRELTEPGVRSNVTVIGLLESHGADIAEAQQVITAIGATPELSAALGCAEGSPLLHIERTYYDRKGEPLEYAVSDFLPDHYSHRLRLGRDAPGAPRGSPG